MSSPNNNRKPVPGFGNVEINPDSFGAGGEEKSRRAKPVAIDFGPVVLPSSAPTVKAPPPAARTQKFVWELQHVPELPECHVLERTAVFVPHSTPSLISRRISDVLRERSIEAVYEDDKAKIKCLTEDGVDFRVRLYRGRNKFHHGIIVEVQRRFGSSLDFRSDTTAILDSAEGKTVPPPPAFGSNNLPLVSDSDDDGYQADGASSLSMVSKMFSHSGEDAHHLALQTLTSLTDSAKVGRSTARKVSEALLIDGDVGGKVLSLILDKKGEDDLFKLRTAAMTVLANALRAVQGKVSGMLREQLHPVLIQELRQAEKNPRMAVQAARCVEMLLGHEQSDADLHAVLTTALEAGKARHAALERQAQICLDKIH